MEISHVANQAAKAIPDIYRGQNSNGPSILNFVAVRMEQREALRFVEDLVTYQMWAHNVNWEPLWAPGHNDVPRHCSPAVASVVFQESIKLRHYYYLDEHYSELFEDVVRCYDVFEQYVIIFGTSWFREEGFGWSRFGIFLSFLVDLAVHCTRIGQVLSIDGVVLGIANYISLHLDGAIKNNGGWPAFEVHCKRAAILQHVHEDVEEQNEEKEEEREEEMKEEREVEIKKERKEEMEEENKE